MASEEYDGNTECQFADGFAFLLREVGTNSTVIFSTHIVDDVKELCNEMAILNGGRILMKTTPKESTKAIEGKIWTLEITREELDAQEKMYDILSTSYNQDNTLNLRVFSDEKPSKEFLAAEPQLDDVYFIALKQDEPVLV